MTVEARSSLARLAAGSSSSSSVSASLAAVVLARLTLRSTSASSWIIRLVTSAISSRRFPKRAEILSGPAPLYSSSSDESLPQSLYSRTYSSSSDESRRLTTYDMAARVGCCWLLSGRGVLPGQIRGASEVSAKMRATSSWIPAGRRGLERTRTQSSWISTSSYGASSSL